MEATQTTMSPQKHIADVPLSELLALSDGDTVIHHALERITEELSQSTRTTVAAFQSIV
jgi:FXSXX-COOH protein